MSTSTEIDRVIKGFYCTLCFFSELSLLLSKLQESFIHLAAQLQVTHEAVKVGSCVLTH